MQESTGTKIVYGIGIVALIWSFGAAYYRYAIVMDYNVSQEVSCDPEGEGGTCFYYICENDWWTPCTGNSDEDIWIYKEIEKPARDVEPGLFAEECGTDFSGVKECPEMACEEGDASCAETYCDPAVDENCYTADTAARVREEWLAVLKSGGIEPVAPEEDLDEEGDNMLDEDESVPSDADTGIEVGEENMIEE